MTAKTQTPKPQFCCPYCTHDKGSRYALKQHKRICRLNPGNQSAYTVRY